MRRRHNPAGYLGAVLNPSPDQDGVPGIVVSVSSVLIQNRTGIRLVTVTSTVRYSVTVTRRGRPQWS